MLPLRRIFAFLTLIYSVSHCRQAPLLPAEVVGRAILPAGTFTPPPADAGDFFAISGRFTHEDGRIRREAASFEGYSFITAGSGKRMTGMNLPFPGQPVQGFSGMLPLGGDEYLAMSDNGFGSKANSADYLLVIYRIRIEWKKNEIRLLERIFLNDDSRVLPFRIVNENAPRRYLTGADLDIESMQKSGNSLFFGDEFGPFLVETDLSGRLLALYDLKTPSGTLVSPDNPFLQLPSRPAKTDFAIMRSRGFEAMAMSTDGRSLLAAPESAPLDQPDKRDIPVFIFDIATRRFTGEKILYRLEHKDHSLGDFQMVSESEGLIIERDNGEGDEKDSCRLTGESLCYEKPALFKRIYRVRRNRNLLEKTGFIDLLHLREGNGEYSFPYITIEDVLPMPDGRILVANDNNVGFSSGRNFGRNDDTEILLLRLIHP